MLCKSIRRVVSTAGLSGAAEHVAKHLVQTPGCFFLHARQQVTVDVERSASPRMTETLRHDLQWHALLQMLRSVTVAKIVEADLPLAVPAAAGLRRVGSAEAAKAND